MSVTRVQLVDRVSVTQVKGEPRRTALKVERMGPPGVPGLDWKGAWGLDTRYIRGDAVSHNGQSWISKLGHWSEARNEPGVGEFYQGCWDVLARKADGLMQVPFGVPQTAILPDAGVLTINLGDANSYFALLDQDVSEVAFSAWPEAGTAQRITLYVAQDGVGGHTISGWPSEVLWPGGTVPSISTGPNAIDCLIFESFSAGAEIFGNYVGRDYR